MEEHAPKSAIISLVINNIISSFIGSFVYAIYAPVEAEMLWCYQFITLIMFILAQYMNLKTIPHPDWYESWAYVPWVLSESP